MFEPRAVAVMSVRIRNAVPMPIATVVLPVNAVQAPPTGVVNQFDRRRCSKRDTGGLGGERGRLG